MLGLGLDLRLGLGSSFTFTSFLPSLLHSRRALLLRHRWRMNKFSNVKIHGRIYSRDDHGAGVSESSPAGVCILGWSRSRSQYFRFEPVSSEISDFTP